MLDASVPRNRKVPKEYNLAFTNSSTINTFIFNEKDLPGYNQYAADRAPRHWINRRRVEKRQTTEATKRGLPSQ